MVSVSLPVDEYVHLGKVGNTWPDATFRIDSNRLKPVWQDNFTNPTEVKMYQCLSNIYVY